MSLIDALRCEQTPSRREWDFPDKEGAMAEGYLWAIQDGKRTADSAAHAEGDVVQLHAAAKDSCVIVAVGDDGTVWVRVVENDHTVHEYRRGV